MGRVVKIYFTTIMILLLLLGVMLLTTVFVVSRNESTTPALPDYGDIVHFDPTREGGHLLPNLNMLIQGEKVGKGVRIITNAKGFRNIEDFSYEPPINVLRILLTGDSHIDGMRTDQKQTVGAILEDILRKDIRTKNIESVEVMISGHNNPVNAWYHYQEHGYKYNPNLVIAGITLGNDITWHNLNTGMLLQKDENGDPILLAVPNAGQDMTRNINLLLPPYAFLPKRALRESFQNWELEIRRFLSSRSILFGYGVPPLLAHTKNARRHVFAAHFLVSLGLFCNPTIPEIHDMLVNFESILMGIKTRVAKHKSRLLLVLFPVRIQVCKKDWDLLKRFYSLDQAHFDLDYPNRRILLFCENNEIQCLDLTSYIRQHYEKGGAPLYRPRGDMHLNEEGQELAAKIIAEKTMELLF